SSDLLSVSKQMQGLQDAGLPGTVVADQHVQAHTRREAHFLEAPQVADIHSCHVHRRLPGCAHKASRPDKPGVRTTPYSTWNTITGAAASPHGVSARGSLGARARSSSRDASPGAPALPSARSAHPGGS